MQFYNTRTLTKEDFTPIQDKKVGLYTCGPTVYHHGHIGNMRAYVFADVTELAQVRKTARDNKGCAESDRLRDAIADRGFVVKDTPDGFEIKKA